MDGEEEIEIEIEGQKKVSVDEIAVTSALYSLYPGYEV